MRKVNTTENTRKPAGILLALSLAASLVMFGCTTNRTRGNGEPTNSMPSTSPTAPTASPGSSSGSTTNPPMISSAVPASVEAIAVMAARQGYQGKVLGPAAGGAGTGGVAVASGQWQSPSALANPQVTVNRSISSEPQPAVTSGADAGTSAIGTTVAAPTVASSTTMAPSTTLAVAAPASESTTSTATTGTTTPATAATAATVANTATASTATAARSAGTSRTRVVNVTTAPDGTRVVTNTTTQEQEGFFRRMLRRLRATPDNNQ